MAGDLLIYPKGQLQWYQAMQPHIAVMSGSLHGVLQVGIPPKVAREAVHADELRLLVNAAFIAGLPQVRCCYPLNGDAVPGVIV